MPWLFTLLGVAPEAGARSILTPFSGCLAFLHAGTRLGTNTDDIPSKSIDGRSIGERKTFVFSKRTMVGSMSIFGRMEMTMRTERTGIGITAGCITPQHQIAMTRENFARSCGYVLLFLAHTTLLSLMDAPWTSALYYDVLQYQLLI